MYICNLLIYLIGFWEKDQQVVEDITLPANGRIKIRTAASLAEVTLAPKEKCSAVIMHSHDVGELASINDKVGENACLVICTDEPDKLTAAQLTRAHNVWPDSFTPELWHFYVQRLADDLYRQRELWDTENCLQTIVDTMPGFLWFKDMEGHHLKVNQGFCEMVGKQMPDIVGKQHYEIWGITPEQYAEGEYVCLETDEAIAKLQKPTMFKEEVLHSKLGVRNLETYKCPIFDEDGDMIGNIGVAYDVTDEYANREQILQMSRTDGLTHLANRRYFYQYVEENRKKGDLTLFYIDLDHFKQLNDTYGHQAGDAALMMVGELLKRAFPEQMVSRLGGDEFAVVIFSVPERAAIQQRLDALCDEAEEFFQIDKALRGLTMSIGIASTKDMKVSLDTLLKRGDEALYYSKAYCRGSYTYYDDIQEELHFEEKN